MVHKPWSASHGKVQSTWVAIVSVLSMQFGVRITPLACQRRFDSLLETFNSNELASLRASGTEEEYGEREVLLTEIKEMVNDFESQKDMQSTQAAEEAARKKAIATSMMEAAMASIEKRHQNESSNDEDSEDMPTTMTKKKRCVNEDGFLQSLIETQKHAMNIEQERTSLLQKQLQLMERQLELREEQFKLDKMEREQQVQLDRLERQQAIKAQAALVDYLSKLSRMTKD
ncbi:hypothetical protein AC1031_009786 [Aphanomyces cochlioides]|nr:hypothetical protein AC1031_009786 [Aphanomyces cochlioides]